MGKHDIGTPINETLEKHYQEQIKTLNAKLDAHREAANGMRREIEKLEFRLKLKDVEIESLVKALAEG